MNPTPSPTNLLEPALFSSCRYLSDLHYLNSTIIKHTNHLSTSLISRNISNIIYQALSYIFTTSFIRSISYMCNIYTYESIHTFSLFSRSPRRRSFQRSPFSRSRLSKIALSKISKLRHYRHYRHTMTLQRLRRLKSTNSSTSIQAPTPLTSSP